MKWREAKSAIMNASKVIYCPVCGELLSFFDRTHVRERHSAYFHAVRKWQLACSLSSVSVPLFLIVGGLSADWFVKWFVVGAGLTVLLFAFSFWLMWLRAAAKFRASGKNNGVAGSN
jgi:hypothetical protein